MNFFPGAGASAQEVEPLLEEAEYLSQMLHQHDEALQLVERAARGVSLRGAGLPARCRIQKAAILKRKGEINESTQNYREALMMISGSRDKALLLACLEGLARNLIARNPEEARKHLIEALTIAVEEGDLMAEDRLRRWLGQIAARNQRLREALSWYKSAHKLAVEGENWAGALADLDRLIEIAEELDLTWQKGSWQQGRQRMKEELETLAHVGQSAAPRPAVMAEARALLLSGEPLDPSKDPPSPEVAEELYQQATSLRKVGQHHQAVPCYLSALSHWLVLGRPAELIACLNGLGISYGELTRGALQEQLAAIHEAELLTGELGPVLRLSHRALQGAGREFAEKARACHRWALELHKEVENLAGQATQISNLALVEEKLGNLDTARRYQRWALGAHRRTGEPAAAALDMRNLARLERKLGDLESAEDWHRQAEGVNREI